MNSFLTLAIILLIGGTFGLVLNHFKLPALLGILLGNCGAVNPELLAISSELRKIALIIILLKAGLSLETEDLKKVGRPAILLSLLPCCMEMCAIGSGLLDRSNQTGNIQIIQSGAIVLSVAVVAILFTALLGAILMDATYQKLLEKE